MVCIVIDISKINDRITVIKGLMQGFIISLISVYAPQCGLDDTKMMISSENAAKVIIKGKFCCAVCRKGVDSNSILSQFCWYWVHKRCSGVRGRLPKRG